MPSRLPKTDLLKANAIDLEAARARDIDAALLDRLELTSKRIASMAEGLRSVAAQSDPVGALSETNRRPSGLEIARMRVAAWCDWRDLRITSQRDCRCRRFVYQVWQCHHFCVEGSEAVHSNRAIAECVRIGLHAAHLPESAVQLIQTTDREAVGALLELDEFVDVIIPRGGKGLVQRISEQARVPVIKHLDGICHVVH